MRMAHPREGAAKDATVHLQGIPYLDALTALHEGLLPRSYLEVGSASGHSLRLASCPTVAIDPQFVIAADVIGRKPALHLLQRPSADAFADPLISALLPRGVDLAFIDGLHIVEAALDDLIGAEAC